MIIRTFSLSSWHFLGLISVAAACFQSIELLVAGVEINVFQKRITRRVTVLELRRKATPLCQPSTALVV